MEALYFPKLSVPSAAWTFPTLLFFDRIRTIAPAGVRGSVLFNGPTRMLIDYGLVEPLDPSPYVFDDSDDAAVLGYLIGAVNSYRNQKKKSHIVRIHIGKLLYTNLAQELVQADLLRECPRGPHEDADWLEGPQWIVDHLMTIIATRILKSKEDLPLITDERRTQKVVIGERKNIISRERRRVNAVQRLIPVGPDVSIRSIVDFRERNKRSLVEFRDYITELSLRSADGQIGEIDFTARVSRAEQHRNELVRQIREIQVGRPSLDIGISVASFVAPVLEQSTYSALAGALGLGYVASRSISLHKQNRRIMQDRLVYAALAHQEFSPRQADDVLW